MLEDLRSAKGNRADASAISFGEVLLQKQSDDHIIKDYIIWYTDGSKSAEGNGVRVFGTFGQMPDYLSGRDARDR